MVGLQRGWAGTYGISCAGTDCAAASFVMKASCAKMPQSWSEIGHSGVEMCMNGILTIRNADGIDWRCFPDVTCADATCFQKRIGQLLTSRRFAVYCCTTVPVPHCKFQQSVGSVCQLLYAALCIREMNLLIAYLDLP